MEVSNTCKISAVRANFARAFPRRALCRNEFSRTHAHFADFVYLQAFGKHYVFLEKTMFFYFCKRWSLKTGRTLFQGTFCFVCISRVVGTWGNYISLLFVLRKTEHVSSAGAARARFARAFRVRISRAAATWGNYVSLPLVFRKTEHVNAAGAVRAFRARISRPHFARGSNMRKLGFGALRFSQHRACQCCWGGARVSRGAGTWRNYVSLPFVFRKTEHVSAAETAGEARY